MTKYASQVRPRTAWKIRCFDWPYDFVDLMTMKNALVEGNRSRPRCSCQLLYYCQRSGLDWPQSLRQTFWMQIRLPASAENPKNVRSVASCPSDHSYMKEELPSDASGGVERSLGA